MTFGERVKNLRRELGLSQETLGTRGFVSTPGWIKIENGQRQASEKLVERLTRWLVEDKHLRAGAANTLKEELLTLKYLGNRSAFVREMARIHARKLSISIAPTPAVKKSATKKTTSAGSRLAAKSSKKR